MGPAGRATFDAITAHTGAEALPLSEVSVAPEPSAVFNVSAVLTVKSRRRAPLRLPTHSRAVQERIGGGRRPGRLPRFLRG